MFRLQKLNVNKLSKQVNNQKQQAVQKVEKKLQAALNNKFPSHCQFASCSFLTFFICSIPVMIWYQKSKKKMENIIQNWLYESNKYLEQYGIQVFRKKIKFTQSNQSDEGGFNHEFDYLVYTFTDEEKQRMIDEVYYTCQNIEELCFISVKLAQYRNDIIQDYQSPDLENYNQNMQQKKNYQNFGDNNNCDKYIYTQQYLEGSVVLGQPIDMDFQMRTDQNLIQ